MANEFIVKNGFKSQGDSEVTGSFTATSGMSGSFSGSFQGDGSSLSNVSLPDGIISSSAQIATDISGAFSADSASFSTRITSNETNINTLINATSSYILASQTSSMSVATASYVQTAETASFLIAPGNNEQIIYNNNGILAGSNKLTFDGADLDVDGIVYFRNVFNNEVDLPAVATHHGMFAHVHGTGLAYYAHVGSGGWNKLASYDRTNSDNLDIIANATMNAGTFTIAGAGNYLQVSNLRLLNNVISAQDTDGNITLTPNGTGTVDVSSAKITNLATPTTSTDAATKGYVDTATNLTASVVSASAESTDATYYPIFADSNGSAGMPIHTDGDLNYNPSTNTLSATNFVGTGSAIEGVVSASYALSASYSVTASHVLGTIDSASYSETAVTASYALTAETLIGSIETASFAFTASFLQGTIESASYADNALTASYALTASFLQGSIDSASYASTASYVETAQTASYIDAANITTGTLTNDRLPANVNVTNVTASFFTGSFVGDGSQLDGVINTPGGADTYVQINSGSTFLGTGSLVFDYTNQRLGINDSSPAYALEVSNPDPADTDSVVSAVNGKFLYSNLYTAAQSGSIPDPAVWHGMMLHYQPEGSYLVSHMSQWFRVATYANDGASIDTYGGRTQNSAGTFAPLANVEIANGYLEVDNLKMDVNTISALDANGIIYLEPSGSGTVDVSSKRITSVATPTAGTDATNKTYVDGEISTPSASFSTRVTTNETDISSLTAATASYILASQTSSMSVLSSSFAVSASYAPSADAFPFSGSAVITGSLTITGSFHSFVLDSDNIVLGEGAGGSMVATADNNVVLGTEAAGETSYNFSGDGNVVVGHQAGFKLSTGGSNVLIGLEAGKLVDNDFSNVFLGTYAGRYQNVVGTSISVGYNALRGGSAAGSTSTGNIAIGYRAGEVVNGAIYNNMMGFVAGLSLSTGDYNTLLGYYAGSSITTGNGNIIIGSGSTGESAISNQLRIGNGNTITTISASLETGDIIFPSTASATYFVGDGSGITGVISSSFASTASYIETAQTASYVRGYTVDGTVLSSSFAVSASYAQNANAFPFVGDAVITGSLIVSGANSQIDTTGGDLISNDGSTSLRWTARRGLDSSGVASLDWQNRSLINGSNSTAIDWSNSYLVDSTGANSVLWDNRALYDLNGSSSLMWDINKRFLVDNNGNTVLNWTNPGQATFEGTSSLATTASYALTASYVAASNIDGSVTNAATASYVAAANIDGTITTASTASYVAASNIDGVIQPRTTSIASSATPTPNADTTDLYIITALAVGATLGAPTGTLVQGQKLTIRIKDNGGAQSLAYNAVYRAFGAALPTTTTVGKTLYLGCIYNSTDSAWDVVAVAEQV